MMKDSNHSVKINYLYRDAANYKEFGFIIFGNPKGNSVKDIADKIKERLIDGEFFDPIEWKFPLINSQVFNQELDHSWYEFHNIELTKEAPTDNRTINEFIESAIVKVL